MPSSGDIETGAADGRSGRSVGPPRSRISAHRLPGTVGRSATPDPPVSPSAGPERVGRSAGPGSEPGPRGRAGRSVGDDKFEINFAPPDRALSGALVTE